jgi:hypothetical protein
VTHDKGEKKCPPGIGDKNLSKNSHFEHKDGDA